MKELLEQGYGSMGIGLITGIGLVIRVVLFGYYVGVCRACKNIERTSNKTIMYIRDDLKERAGRNQTMRSTMIYTECRLAECRICGIRIGVLECILQQSILVVLLSGVLTAFAAVLLGCDAYRIVVPLFISGMVVLTFLIFDLLFGLREKEKRIRLSIRDYIENGCMLRTKSGEETEKQKQSPERKKERRKKREVLQTKELTGQSRKKQGKKYQSGKAQEEKRRLTEELLRERRQMEARRLTILQSREQEEEAAVKQAQAEAAAADSSETAEMDTLEKDKQDLSYEAMLREIIAEYL